MPIVPILTTKAFGLTVGRLYYQLIEDHGDLDGVALVGLQPQWHLACATLAPGTALDIVKEVL